MAFNPHKETLNIYLMQVRQLFLEKLKRKFENNGSVFPRK